MRIAARLLAGAALAACLAASVPAQTRIKVGALTDLSGAYADLSDAGSVVAARLAASGSMAANKGFQVDIMSDCSPQ